MSQPQDAKYSGDCTYLGSYARFKLYFCSQGYPVPIVVARSGNGTKDYQWPVDCGPGSSVLEEMFRHALDLARQQGLLELE